MIFIQCHHSLLASVEEGAIMVATVDEKIPAESPIKKTQASKKRRRKLQRKSKCKFCLRSMSTCYLKRHVERFCKSRNYDNRLLQEMLGYDNELIQKGRVIHGVICDSQHRVRVEELSPEHKQALEMFRTKLKRCYQLMTKTLDMYQREVQCCDRSKGECCDLSKEVAPLDEEKTVIDTEDVNSLSKRKRKRENAFKKITL